MMQIVIDIPEEYYKAITEIPNHQCTADMLIIKNGTPLPKGHWIEGNYHIRCSECGEDYTYRLRNYCPNCGAKMQEVQNVDR